MKNRYKLFQPEEELSIESLKIKLELKEESNNRLMKKLASSEREKDQLKLEIDNLNQNILVLKEELEKQKPDLSKFEDEKNQLISENRQLKNEISEIQEKLGDTVQNEEIIKEDFINFIVDEHFDSKDSLRKKSLDFLKELFKEKKNLKHDEKPLEEDIDEKPDIEGKTTKQRIIELLSTGSLEERQIIDALQYYDIPEGTVRTTLNRERDRLFKKNTQGEWEMRQ